VAGSSLVIEAEERLGDADTHPAGQLRRFRCRKRGVEAGSGSLGVLFAFDPEPVDDEPSPCCRLILVRQIELSEQGVDGVGVSGGESSDSGNGSELCSVVPCNVGLVAPPVPEARVLNLRYPVDDVL